MEISLADSGIFSTDQDAQFYQAGCSSWEQDWQSRKAQELAEKLSCRNLISTRNPWVQGHTSVCFQEPRQKQGRKRCKYPRNVPGSLLCEHIRIQ